MQEKPGSLLDYSKTTARHAELPVAGDGAFTRPLKICIASCEFMGPIRNGGIGTAYTSMARTLTQAGHQVTLFYTQGAKCENETIAHWEQFYQKMGIRFVARASNPSLRIDAPAHASISYESYQWLKQQSFDLVHFPEWRGEAYYSLLARHQGIAFANTLFCVGTHSPTSWLKEANSEFYTQPQDLEVDFMERRSVALADFVISPCHYMLDWMVSHGFTLSPRHYVRQNILPQSARGGDAKPKATNCPPVEIVFFGRLETRKGIELFCNALDRLAGIKSMEQLLITFLGKPAHVTGKESHAYINTRSEKWPWRTNLVGNLDQEGAMRYLQQPGRLAVIPSLMENSPYTVLECLGNRISFLASRVGGIPELIAAGDQDRATFEPREADLALLLRQTVESGTQSWSHSVEPAANEKAWVAWHNSLAEGIFTRTAVPTASPGATPRVSVCVAHFNRPQMLRQALASLEAQDYPNFEVLVVDDGSIQPEALAYLAELELQLPQKGWQLIRQQNRYLSAARNTGARAATGEFLMFMDDDNYAKPREISTFVKVALRTQADIVTCCMDYFEGNQPPPSDPKTVNRWVPLGPAASAGFFRNVFGDANCLVRKEIFEKLGGFTELYGVTHEDWEFLAKAVLENFRLEVIPEALFHYRYVPGSMIRSTSRYRNYLRHIRPYLQNVPKEMHQILLMAQGANQEVGMPPAVQKALTQHTIKWRSEFEAGRRLAQLGHPKQAMDLLQTGIKSAQASQYPPLILEAMLAVGQEMVPLDKTRANELLRLAVRLAENIRQSEPLRLAKAALAAISKDSPASCPSPTPTQPKGISETASITIVIPVFNKLALTKACLESIRQTSGSEPLEIIVVDNASNDGTAEYLQAEQAAGNLRCLTNDQNAGFARACNQGAEAARSGLVVFLNNDTRVTKGWAAAMARAAIQKDAGVVGAKLLYPDGRVQHAGIEFINGVPDHPFRHAAADAPEVNHARDLDMVTGACLMIHRDLFLKLGGFDEVYKNGVEDADLCLRARAAGYKVIYEPKAVVYHHEGQTPGRFNHVSDNLNRFFSRWRGWFDKQHRFIVPTPPRIVEASQSLFTRPQAVKTGAAANPIAVDWVGSFLDHGSLSHVNRSLLAAFKSRTELRVKGISTSQIRADGFKALEQDLQTHASPDVAVTVRHSWPPNWGRPTHGRLVVIQPWEFGMLPKEWVDQAPQVDEFWVPTRFVKDCYAASGIPAHKVFVVPNGVDAKLFHPGAEARALATTKRFKFLFVGGTIGRKGPDLLLQAYLQNFSATDDVCLVIKDFGGDSFYAGQTFDTRIRAAQTTPGAPEILYIKEEMPPEDLPGLYTACQCLVLPYRGEGFGLPVLEAMACGLPVIVTAGGATDDFVRSEFGWQISAQKRLIGEAVGGMKLAGEGWMLEPEIQEIGEAMRKAFGDPTGARDRGLLASRHVHDHFTWNHAAEQAVQRIRALARGEENRKDSKIGKSFEGGVPATARVGNLNEARRLFGLKKPEPAWKAACAAISPRPFHPEGWLLLAEIAAAQGDGSTARACAQRAREMAPGWNPPRQFLNKPLRGNTKLDWIKPPSRSPVLLTVCLIARNEERFLGACLKSIQGLNAQIIVVDTGSTDRTVEIARDFGAEVYSFTWSDDFAAARNAALEHARGDWVLMLDADEELPKDQHAALMGDIAQAKVLGYRLPLVNIEHEAHGRSHVPRLFRNMPGIFYTGRIHEQIFPSLMPHTKAWGLDLAIGTAQITHHGYTRQMMVDRDKIQRNLKLLQLAVSENPMDVNLMMNLGLEWVRSGDLAAGVDQYRKAFHLMTAGREDETAPELREVLLTQFTSHLYKMRHHEEVVEVLNSKLVQRGGLTASLHFAMGLAHFELKQFAEAAAQMQQCIRKRGEKSLAPVNTDIHTTAPEHCLALSLARKGDAEASEKCFLEVLGRTQPQSGALAEIKLDYARFLTNQNRGVEAFHKLHELVAANSKHLAAWQFGAEAALTRPEFLEFGRDWTTEAVKYAGEDFTLHHHRAEILMLLGENATAAVIWERLWSSERQPGILAALILCELINGKVNHAPGHGADEPSTSRAFIKWYQKLISMKSFKVVARVNESLSSLQGVLPNAAAMLQKALEECQPASR